MIEIKNLFGFLCYRFLVTKYCTYEKHKIIFINLKYIGFSIILGTNKDNIHIYATTITLSFFNSPLSKIEYKAGNLMNITAQENVRNFRKMVGWDQYLQS